MQLSKIAISLKPSATLKLNELSSKLKSEGKDIIHLGGREPEFDISDYVIKKIEEKIRTKRIKYTPASGIQELKEKVAFYCNDIYQTSIKPDNIVISSGAEQCIYNFLMSTVDPGDEVIILAPYWFSYTEIVSMVYGTSVIVKPKKRLIPDFDEVLSHITSHTKAILINSSNNSTGLVYPNELIEKIIKYCEENNIYVLMDFIYDQLILDNIKIKSPFLYINDIN